MATGGLQDSNRGHASDFIGECDVTRSCEPCMKTNISKEATVFCKDCNEYLCETCKNPHLVYKPGKHHMTSIQNNESSTVIVDMKGMDKCSEHGKGFKFFCEDHSKLCCTTCVIAHRKCEKWDEITSISRQKGAELHGLKQSLLKLKSDTDAIVAECNQTEKELNSSVADVSKDVDEMRDRVIKLFDAAKHELLAKANALKSEEVKRLGQIQSVSTKVVEEINQLVSMCSSIAEQGTPRQMFVFSKQIEEKYKTIESKMNEQRMTPVSSKLTLSYTGELSSLLEMEKHFMEVKLERTGNHSSIRLPFHPRPVTLKLLVSIDLQQTGDDEKEPQLTGLDFLPDGRLIAVDNQNKKCIVLNEQLQRLGTPYKFQWSPMDVVALSRSEIAVTLGNKTICFLSVSSGCVISLTRQINTSTDCFSISCKTPTNMVVSTFKDPRPVRMLSVDGVETDFDQVKLVNKTYTINDSRCTYVQRKNTLVLTDRVAHTVFIYDTVNGTSRAVTDGNIHEPCGACVGPGDTVLVCSKNKNSIVHMDVDGVVLGTYPVDMLYPRCMCMSRDGTRLAVSNSATDAKKVQLYKIPFPK